MTTGILCKDKLALPKHEYMTLLAVRGLKRVLDQKGFTRSSKAQQELDNFEMVNDSIKSFLSDKDINVFSEKLLMISTLHTSVLLKNSFKAFCKDYFQQGNM